MTNAEVQAHIQAMRPTLAEIQERLQKLKSEGISIAGITGERYSYDIIYLQDQAYGKAPNEEEILFVLKYVRDKVREGGHVDEIFIPSIFYHRHVEALLQHIEHQGGVS